MKTPSTGIDQNKDGKFIDRYWGRVPMFLHRMDMKTICIPNPDYIRLVQLVIDDEIPLVNISQDLLKEITWFIDRMCNPCLMNDEEKALFRAFQGLEPCIIPEAKEDCDAMVCCNSKYLCSEPVDCPDGSCSGPEVFSMYSIDVGSDSCVDNTAIYGYNGDNDGCEYGNLTLLSGIDLHLTAIYSEADSSDVTDIHINSSHYCDGQDSMTMESIEHPELNYTLYSDQADSRFSSLFDVDNDGFGSLHDETITLKISRLGCNVCNLVSP